MLVSRALIVLLRCTGLLAGVVLAGCNSGGGRGPLAESGSLAGPPPVAAGPVTADQPATADPGFAFPSPSQLPRAPQPRRASYTEEEIVMSGAGFFSALPHQNVTQQGDRGVYNADWSGGLDGAAFGIYRFDTTGFDREPILKYRWDPAPTPLGSAWIGLANWPADRWEWRQCSAAGQFDFGDTGPYGNPIDRYMYAAVVVAGTSAGELRFIRIGDSLLTAEVAAAPATGVAPCTISFDGSGSFSPFGLSDLALFHWDFDGDGTIDDSGPAAEVTHEYSTGGTYDASLTVESAYGELAAASASVTLYDPWSHSWGGPGNEWFHDVASDGTAIYLAGATESFANGDGQAVLLLKYALDGTLLWSRAWSGPVDDNARCLAVVGGDIFTAGQTESFGAGDIDLLLQRWDSDGNLVWTRTWGLAGTEYATGIGVRDGTVYVCGSTNSFADANGDGIVLAWDYDGDVVWSRILGTPDKYEGALDLQTATTPVGGFTRLHIAGSTRAYGGSHSKLLYAQFSSDGTLLELKSMDLGDNASATTVQASGGLIAQQYVAGQFHEGLNTSSLLVAVAADPLVLRWGGAGDMSRAEGLVRRGDALYVAGYAFDALGGGDGYLYRFSTLGALEKSTHWSASERYESFAGLAQFPGGGLICAGQAYAAAGDWTVTPVSFEALDLEWNDQALNHYDAAIFEPIVGSPSQQPDNITAAVLDAHAGGDFYEGLVGVVAQ